VNKTLFEKIASPTEAGETERPLGWSGALLSEVCEINPAKPFTDDLKADELVTFVPMPAVDADAGVITSPQVRRFSDVRKGFTAFRNGDVIMAKITPCMENGKAAIASGLTNGLGFGSTEFHVLRSTGAVLAGLVYYFIRQESFRRAAESEMTGSVGQKRVPVEFLRFSEIPLPPFAEQERIVAKVGELLVRVNVAREHLARVPAILKRFRQAVLAAACDGRLTGDWRQQHPGLAIPAPKLTPASEGRPRGRRGANLSAAGELILDEAMPEIPVSWSFLRADSVVAPETVITYGIVLPGPEVPGGVPYVRQQDIEDGVIRLDGIRHTSQEIARKHDRSSLRGGDVLLCIIRNLRVALVTKALDGANITQGSVRLRPSHWILGPYLVAFLSSRYAQAWMKSRYFGMDMPRINVEDARALPIAVPPVLEQYEIVRRVEALFRLADAVEKRVAAATARAGKLTEAILARAFRGELVPTEAELARREGREYERAAALLERVRGESTTANTRDEGRRIAGAAKRVRARVDG
jgi:type I restriction enzyme S subunit